MHRALGTGGLAFLKRALLKPQLCVSKKLAAIGTQYFAAVLLTTVQSNHGRDGLCFPGYAGSLGRHFEHNTDKPQELRMQNTLRSTKSPMSGERVAARSSR
jgi:hypothetical protein